MTKVVFRMTLISQDSCGPCSMECQVEVTVIIGHTEGEDADLLANLLTAGISQLSF